MSLQDQTIAWLAGQDIQIYLVGGCVRDRLLGRPVYDLDVAVDGDGLRLARRLANRFGGAYYPLDDARQTGRAILDDQRGEHLVVDVARLRGQDLAADLADRDFSLNALAANALTAKSRSARSAARSWPRMRATSTIRCSPRRSCRIARPVCRASSRG